ncbi:Metallo-dependent phosphatase-like protein [Infundibulicybe gibba]|nr:Metallo-dependent phosphatase-like protein [Infundibulicybe gibba]
MLPHLLRVLVLVTGFLGICVVSQSLEDQILQALQNTVDCDSCLDLLGDLKAVAVTGDNALIDLLTSVCIDTKHHRQTAGKLCDALFGFCATPPVNPFTVPFPRAAPAHLKPVVAPNPRRKPFTVVHLSDVHIDHQYTIGSEANCTKNICCRNFADEAGKPITVPAGPIGNSKCDSTVTLANSMLEAIDALNPKFSIFTGDVVEGREVTTDLMDFNAQLAAKLTVPIFPALGNHDSAPVNAFARSTTATANNSQFVFDTQSQGWERFIGQTAANQVDHNSGSYSVLVPGTKLRIISINTQYWYKQNLWLFDTDEQQPDPNGLLAFIVQELQIAEDAGERAWIIGHIPLGKEDTFDDQSNYFDQIVQRYKLTIAGHFFGHSHKDQFEIAYSDYSNQIAANAVSIALIAPALTPTSGNPAFKLYDVDPDTFEVMDAKVFFTNVTEPSFQTKPEWGLYYSARETWGPLVGLKADSALTPAFWHNLTDVFVANDTAFQLFNTHISRGGAVTACDGDCKNSTICDMRAFRSQNNCDTPETGFSLKRDAGGRVIGRESSECEGFSFGQLLSKMAAKR